MQNQHDRALEGELIRYDALVKELDQLVGI